MARVVLENVSKSFDAPRKGKVPAVRDFSLAIEDKEFLVLVGPSGCGKTTVLRLIAGLEEMSSGTISIDGRVVNDVKPKDRDIAMVFQNYALYPHMTVYENIAFGLEMRKVPKTEIQDRVSAVAQTLGLTELLNRLPKALSGGQRQRVAVGRAIVRNPKAFLFDEPLSNLDAQMRVQMRLELTRLHQRLAATMIYVTHDQTEAMTMGDRIVVMREGVIQQVADPIQLYNHPANVFVAAFIGSPPMNLLPGRIDGDGNGVFFVADSPDASARPNRLRTDLPGARRSVIGKLTGQRITLGARPEAVIIKPAGRDPSHWNLAAIEAVEPLGAETLIHLRVGNIPLVARVPPDARCAVGNRVTVEFDSARLHFFDSQSGNSVAD